MNTIKLPSSVDSHGYPVVLLKEIKLCSDAAKHPKCVWDEKNLIL